MKFRSKSQKDRIDPIKSKRFMSKSQKKDKIDSIKPMNFRIKSQKDKIDPIEWMKFRSKSQKTQN